MQLSIAPPAAWTLAMTGASPAGQERAPRAGVDDAVDPTAQWVREAQRGDRAAFAKLYETFAPVVHGVLLAQARSGEVHDLLQDVFVAALRRLGQLEHPAQFGGWICTIARNHARDDHKRLRPEIGLEREPARSANDDERDEAARALAALRSLPQAYRETLALRLIEGLSGPDIAARTGMTAGSVRVNLCRGMKLLRAELEIRGGAR
jgi:RNA polymerase sigma-70 factor (ECF subfamily)